MPGRIGSPRFPGSARPGYRHIQATSIIHQDDSMAHPYPIREIARQAGVSEATVDRVLNLSLIHI